MFAFILASLFALVHSDNWAVLVAGSNTFSNYRHQADIFHTWQILTKNGFDPKKIIVMAYDDIATVSTNPFPGHVYNVPDGPDVYIGSENIAYRGKNVTAAKFYAVITGDAAAAGGPVLESTEEDNVFIYFDDHGGSGCLCFPTGGYSYASDLYKRLCTMHEKKLYKNLLIYVEACYAGSMFINYTDTLAQNNVYVMTAANNRESSYAEYCGISKYKTCLSNEFSARWMEYSESQDLKTTTIEQEFNHTKEATVQSHVSEYGDTSMKSAKLAEFQAHTSTKIPEELKSIMRPLISSRVPSGRRISQQQAYMTYLETAAQVNEFTEEAAEYQAALILRAKENNRATALAGFFGIQYPMRNYTPARITVEQEHLYRRAIETYEDKLGRLNEFNLWSHTAILHTAVARNVLTEKTFAAYEAFLANL